MATKLAPAELVDQFETYTLLEISEFVKLFEDKFGVTAAERRTGFPNKA